MRLGFALVVAACTFAAAAAHAAGPNKVLGTWRLASATIDPDGAKTPAYGQVPSGMLSFSPDMHFVIVLTNGDSPRFASNVRGQGTDAENRLAMANSIGFFGTYTVDDRGEFSGNKVEGSTFPNWIGGVRTTKELKMVVNGDQMMETFQRPDGTRIEILWQRLK